MKMKITRSVFSSVIIIILVVLNLIVLGRYIKNNKIFRNNIKKINIEKHYLYEELLKRETLLREIFNSRVFSYDVYSTSFKSELYKSKKVIFYFPKESCATCIEKIFQDLEILSKKIGRENIVVATNLEKEGVLLKNRDYNFKQIFIDTFFIDKPVVFIADSSFNVDILYVPKLFPEFQQDYFIKILPEYYMK